MLRQRLNGPCCPQNDWQFAGPSDRSSSLRPHDTSTTESNNVHNIIIIIISINIILINVAVTSSLMCNIYLRRWCSSYSRHSSLYNHHLWDWIKNEAEFTTMNNFEILLKEDEKKCICSTDSFSSSSKYSTFNQMNFCQWISRFSRHVKLYCFSYSFQNVEPLNNEFQLNLCDLLS